MTGESQLCIVLIVFQIAAAYFGYRIFSRQKEPEEIDFFDSLRLQREVRELAAKMNELEALDNMIIDLRLCKPAEVMRAFRMEWQGAAGIEHKFDFMADGQSASSEHLMELAIEERAALNQEIAERIYDLYTRASRLSLLDDLPE